MTIKWKSHFTVSHIPCPPEQRCAYDAALDELARMILAMGPCEHLHIIYRVTPILTDEGWDEGKIEEVCADCGKTLIPAMPEPIDCEQLADSEE